MACCNQNCNQGRDCPTQKPPTNAVFSWLLAVVLTACVAYLWSPAANAGEFSGSFSIASIAPIEVPAEPKPPVEEKGKPKPPEPQDDTPVICWLPTFLRGW